MISPRSSVIHIRAGELSAAVRNRASLSLSASCARRSLVMSRDTDRRRSGLPSGPVIGVTTTSHHRGGPLSSWGEALEPANPTCPRGIDRAGRGITVRPRPELRPGAAPNLLNVVDLHDDLAARAHELEPGIEVEHLDAVP